MHDGDGKQATWSPQSGSDQAAIRQQLERILASQPFRNSKRYPNLLRYTVEHTLLGDVENLKERTLGVEVFHRNPDYDTNLDPVVRTTAVEIRKRLIQYYKEAGRDHEIRIELPSGSYVPRFRKPETPVVEETPLASAIPARSRRKLVVGAAAMLAFAATAGWALHAHFAVTPFERFWMPVWESSGPVLLCVAPALPASAGVLETVQDLMEDEKIELADATTLSRISGLMKARGKPTRIRFTPRAKMDDLKEGPAVLIGAFRNPSTSLVPAHFRYRFEHRGTALFIIDQQDPTRTNWGLQADAPYRSVSTDYAIVSRVLDPATGQIVVTAAGIAKYGTAAAGEFLADPQHIAQMAKSAPADWYRKNLEIVIAVPLSGDRVGVPTIVATHFW